MVFFSSYGINRSIWLDEAICPLFSSGSINSIIENLKTDNHPPLYFFLLSVWMKVFGQSETALRSLSGLFYFLCVFSVYFIMRELYDQKTGVICALLFLLSPLAIKHAQNARSYTLLALFSILSSGYFFKTFIQQKCSAKNAAIYVLFNIFGTFTHYCFAFVLISHLVSFIFYYYSWKLIKTFLVTELLSVAPFAVFWSPILKIQLGLNTATWIPEPQLLHLVKAFFEFFHPVFYVILLILLILQFKDKCYSETHGLRGLKTYDSKSDIRSYIQKGDIVWVYLFGGSFFTLFLFSFIKLLFIARYTIVTLFPFVVILSYLIRNTTLNYKSIIIGYLLVFISIIGFVKRVNEPWHEVPNRTTAKYLVHSAKPGDIILFTYLNKVALEYYLDYYNCKEMYTIYVFPAEVAEHVGWINEKAMLERESELEEEARGLAIKLKSQLSEDNSIWFITHRRFKTPQIIKKELDSIFIETRVKAIRGAPFYNEIITYVR